MNISDYLQRIRYPAHQSTEPSYPTLRALHRAHLLVIPYENLDIHLGQPLQLDQQHIYEKVVNRGRGGWCYEMNGLFAWALRELGFDVTLLGGSVNRAELGDAAHLNHLVLMVQLNQPYLVDVGFGNGFVEPLLLAEGVYRQGFLTYRLKRTAEGWYFNNHQYGGPGFDFTLHPYAITDFAPQCHNLQTSPTSGFVLVTVCHRHTPDGTVTLKGATLQTVTGRGLSTRTITTEAEYRETLATVFDLHFSENVLSPLWEKVWRDHQEWVQSQTSV